MKVSNLTNVSGKAIPNQIIITHEDGTRMFQSYDSAIALVDASGGVHLSEHWNYSTTTAKYRTMFLNESTQETKRRIREGEYLMDLNLDGVLMGVTS